MLGQEQRYLVAAPGIEEDQEPAAGRAKVAVRPDKSRGDRFAAGLAALAAFGAEGHARPARIHRTGDGPEPGSGVNDQHARRDTPAEEQRGQLEALGVAM
ncbi:hypothetical protein ACFVVL_26675 [Kitasatospora sp. NPDC058115]|uniref:hypothetical protein n=1 Tax=Kitasatospora sp. NPDC058115 TaxID=3346347 RepID=UPI0036DDDC20